VTWREHPPE